MAAADTVKELEGALGVLRPQLEGFRDLERALTGPGEQATREITTATIRRFAQREGRLVAALQALTALADDDYPNAISISVNAEIYAKLREQLDTITAALSRVAPPGEAITGSVSIGEPTLRQ